MQDNIRYIAYEDGYSGYIAAGAQDVLAKKFGDCKGMANLLTEMLKLAGYDSHFTWIGTRQLPYPQSMPALCVNNHAICTLNFSGKTYFLDATENYDSSLHFSWPLRLLFLARYVSSIGNFLIRQ